MYLVNNNISEAMFTISLLDC